LVALLPPAWSLPEPDLTQHGHKSLPFGQVCSACARTSAVDAACASKAAKRCSICFKRLSDSSSVTLWGLLLSYALIGMNVSIFWDTNIKSRLIISRREDRFHGEVIVRADVYAIFGLRSGYLNRYRPGAVSSSRTRARSYVCFCNLTRNRRRRIADGFETKYLSLSNLRRFSSINPRPRLRAFRRFDGGQGRIHAFAPQATMRWSVVGALV